MATVISNLLENAVLAASKTNSMRKRVSMIIHITKKQLIIEIRNTFGERLVLDDHTGLPITETEKGHGYGMKSVSTFVQKYDAILDFTMEGEEAIVRLLVQNV